MLSAIFISIYYNAEWKLDAVDLYVEIEGHADNRRANSCFFKQ